MNEIWVGVNVSKQTLDIAVRPGGESWLEQSSPACPNRLNKDRL